MKPFSIIQYEQREYRISGKFSTTREVYGSDADGNRGELVEWVDNIIIENVISENGEDLYASHKELCDSYFDFDSITDAIKEQEGIY